MSLSQEQITELLRGLADGQAEITAGTSELQALALGWIASIVEPAGWARSLDQVLMTWEALNLPDLAAVDQYEEVLALIDNLTTKVAIVQVSPDIGLNEMTFRVTHKDDEPPQMRAVRSWLVQTRNEYDRYMTASFMRDQTVAVWSVANALVLMVGE